MIERYTRPEMGALWEPENKFRKWLEGEIAVCEAWASKGRIPKRALNTIKKKADFSVARIDEIEAEVRHDVIAFLNQLVNKIGS